MDLLFYRYRHLTLLLVAIVAQLGLLAYQVRNDQNFRLIRVWSVAAVSPLARLFDGVRHGTSDFFDDYVLLWDARQENKQLHAQLDHALLESHQMKADLGMADRVQALAIFQKESPMKLVAGRIFMNTPASGSGVNSTVYVDVGRSRGVQKDMAVITPKGIVGKIIEVYGEVSMVMLMNDPRFGAGVVSVNHRVQGTLRGQGNGSPLVEFVQNEQPVEPGEWFYTTGNDFIFPRGQPVGTVEQVKNGLHTKDIRIRPSGYYDGIDEVLVVLNGVHAPIPEAPVVPHVTLMQPPPEAPATDEEAQAAQTGPLSTEADRVMNRVRSQGAKASHDATKGPSATPASPNVTVAPKPGATAPGPAKAAVPSAAPRP